ncbi:MAG TPA: hypothetical protein PL029_10800, partial [Bacteroidia bacterium]|nr:hypothetical protein [Bacteroidia bacterium]
TPEQISARAERVKFEAGPMEQVFKFSLEEVKNVDNLKTIITPEFIENARLRFNDMFKQMKGLAL